MPPKTTVAPRALRLRPDLVAAQRVAGVDPDADDVAGLHAVEVERLQRLVGDARRRHTRPASPPPSTNSQRGVITPTPNDRWLGFTRWTVMPLPPRQGWQRAERRRQFERATQSDAERALSDSTSSRSCSGSRGLPEARRLKRRHAMAWHQSGGQM